MALMSRAAGSVHRQPSSLLLRALKQWLLPSAQERTPAVLKYSTTAAVRRQDRESDDEESSLESRKRHSSSSSSAPSWSSHSGLLSDTMNPFQTATSLLKMMDTMDRLFESPFSPIFSTNGMGHSGSGTTRPLMPSKQLRTPWDVMEDAKAFKLRMDMPGLGKEDVKVRVEDGTLIIQGEERSSLESKDKEEGWSGLRSSYGKYEARILLPENVKMGEVKATVKNGVLFVNAPKEVEGVKKELFNVEVN